MITIETAKLIPLLRDLLETCGYRGVYIGSVRGEFGAEPGEVSLLVGTSTNGAAIGHTWVDAVAGDLEHTLWPANEVTAAMSVYKALSKRKGHTVDISVEGEAILIRETPALFEGGTELRFDYKKFEDDDPTVERWRRILNNEPLPEPVDTQGEPRPDIPRTSWSHHALEPLVRIARRRGETLHLFANHAQQLNRAQIGDTWIGAVAPLAMPGHDDDYKPTETGHFDDRGTPTLSDGLSHLDDAWLAKIGALWAHDSGNGDAAPTDDGPAQPPLPDADDDSEGGNDA